MSRRPRRPSAATAEATGICSCRSSLRVTQTRVCLRAWGIASEASAIAVTAMANSSGSFLVSVLTYRQLSVASSDII